MGRNGKIRGHIKVNTKCASLFINHFVGSDITQAIPAI